MRGYLSNPKFLKSKVANSQSPIQKKRLLEFATHNLKNDKSMQGLSSKGNLNPQTSNSTKVIDFRREIDRRFQNSIPNQTYVFPRANQDASSAGSSFDSVRDLGQYDLHTQDFKRSVLLERERASLDNKDMKVKNRSFESPPQQIQQQINTARDYYVDPKVASIKNKMIETGGITHRETSKGANDSADFAIGVACKKFFKLPSPKAQRNVVLSQKEYKKDQREDNNSVGSRKLESQNSETSSKTINLNVNVNMNMNIDYRDSKDGNNRAKMATSPPANAECFINCNFFPKTVNNHKTKDLKVHTSKSPNAFGNLYKSIELKTLQTTGNLSISSKPLRKGATPTTSSTADKSLTSKSSYSLMQNDIDKAVRQNKKSKPSNGNILSSSLRRDGSSTSRGGEEGKTQRNLKATTLYQKAQHDILKKLKVPESMKEFNNSYGQLHNFVTDSHSVRSTVGKDNRGSQRTQSPQVNNFFIPMTNTSSKMASKNSTLTKSNKDLLTTMTDRGLSLSSKEASCKSKTREEEGPRYLDVKKFMEKGEVKKELSMTQRINKEKSKMKLNLHGLTQRLGPFSDRGGDGSERNEQKNKSHSEYFR